MAGLPIDTASITSPCKAQLDSPDYPSDGEILLALRDLRCPVRAKIPQDKKFMWINSAGPYGSSIGTSLTDLGEFME